MPKVQNIIIEQDANFTEFHKKPANSRKEFVIGTVLYKTKSLDGTKPNTNPITNTEPNTNRTQLFYAIFEHRPIRFKKGL